MSGPLSKLAEESEVRGDALLRTGVFTSVHEDSSTASTNQFASSVEFGKRSICFVSPHPDDVELYCGGVLLDHAQKNDTLWIIMMTYGGKGTINPFLRGAPLEKIREQEARTRYSLLNQVEFIFAGFKDTEVVYNDASVNHLTSILKTINPDVIYAPEYHSRLSERQHKDHIHTGKIIVEARTKLAKPSTLRCYHSLSVNTLIKVDEYYEKNNEAIQLYKSQKGFPIWPFLSSLTRFHYQHNKKRKQWGKQIQASYAEGFREVNF